MKANQKVSRTFRFLIETRRKDSFRKVIRKLILKREFARKFLANSSCYVQCYVSSSMIQTVNFDWNLEGIILECFLCAVVGEHETKRENEFPTLVKFNDNSIIYGIREL